MVYLFQSGNHCKTIYIIFISSVAISIISSTMMIIIASIKPEVKWWYLISILLYFISNLIFVIGLITLFIFYQDEDSLSKKNNININQKTFLGFPKCKFITPSHEKSYTIHGDINNKCKIIVKPYVESSQSEKDDDGKNKKSKNGG